VEEPSGFPRTVGHCELKGSRAEDIEGPVAFRKRGRASAIGPQDHDCLGPGAEPTFCETLVQIGPHSRYSKACLEERKRRSSTSGGGVVNGLAGLIEKTTAVYSLKNMLTSDVCAVNVSDRGPTTKFTRSFVLPVDVTVRRACLFDPFFLSFFSGRLFFFVCFFVFFFSFFFFFFFFSSFGVLKQPSPYLISSSECGDGAFIQNVAVTIALCS